MKLLKSLILLAILLANSAISVAAVPDVHVNDKFPLGDGKFTKIAYSDVFTTNIEGERVKMRVAYAVALKDHPTVMFEILSEESDIYREMELYVNTMNTVLDKFAYTGNRLGDIIVNGKEMWMLASKYAVAGSSLALVRLTYDDVGSSKSECIGITLPLSFMDCAKYKFNGKNHWKDMQASLCNGDCQSIEYWFCDPVTGDRVSVTLPVTNDMVLAIRQVVNAYK